MSARVTMLCGGVGGAKLARGFQLLAPDVDLTVIVNTGDDFEHLGLLICPDLDTLIYTLTGQANRAQGWGREDESWTFMRVLRTLGGDDWFLLGDGDLALHLYRNERLRAGRRLSGVVADVAAAWGLSTKVLPMSDHPVRTMVHTEEGILPFQEYFVRRRCDPRTSAISFMGIEAAQPAPGVLDAITTADILVLAPSNPFLSIDPILRVPGIKDAIRARCQPAIAVSPLVGGKAVKGPTDKLMGEMGLDVANEAIASHYHGLINGLLIHEGDPSPAELCSEEENILMRDDADKRRVATRVLSFAVQIAGR